MKATCFRRKSQQRRLWTQMWRGQHRCWRLVNFFLATFWPILTILNTDVTEAAQMFGGWSENPHNSFSHLWPLESKYAEVLVDPLPLFVISFGHVNRVGWVLRKWEMYTFCIQVCVCRELKLKPADIFKKVAIFKGFIQDTRGNAFFRVDSLLAPGLHPFRPHFSPQKSGKPEIFSVNWGEKKSWKNRPSSHLGNRLLGDILSGVIHQLLITEDDKRPPEAAAATKRGNISPIALLSTFVK